MVVGGALSMSRFRSCVHFRGIQNVCAAGIDPKSVRDTSGPGMATWPCLDTGKGCATACPQRRMQTDAEISEEDARIEAAVAKFETDLASGKCPHCQITIEARRVSGRCAYAVPCGHRLGQVGGDEVGR